MLTRSEALMATVDAEGRGRCGGFLEWGMGGVFWVFGRMK